MIKRITAREFQRSFQKQEEPVIVGHGIWFPEATAALLAMAEGTEFLPVEDDLTDYTKRSKTIYAPVKDFSKTAQVKGKMGR